MFYIEGNIGAGKTTFIKLFQKYLENVLKDSHLILEPVDSWLNTKDSKGKHILEYYYEDPKKHGFTFQMTCTSTPSTRTAATTAPATPTRSTPTTERGPVGAATAMTAVPTMTHRARPSSLRAHGCLGIRARP